MLNKSLSCYGLDMEKHSQSDSGSDGGGGEFNDNGNRKFCLLDRFSLRSYLIMFSVDVSGNTGGASRELEGGDGSAVEPDGKEILYFEQILWLRIQRNTVDLTVDQLRGVENLMTTVRKFCLLYIFSLRSYLIMFSVDVSGNTGGASRELEGGDGSAVEPNGKEILYFEQILSYVITYHVII
jgi:hypothetical protein